MSGGEAKALIAEGRVRVNGEVELRKRRKMAIGDRVELEDGRPSSSRKRSNRQVAKTARNKEPDEARESSVRQSIRRLTNSVNVGF